MPAMKASNTFIGKLVSLRAIEPEDLETLYTIENDPALWQVGSANVPYSRYSLKRFIAQNTNDIFTDHQLRLMIEENSTRQTVGMVDITDISFRHHRAEVGIVIARRHQEKGFGTEALSLVEDYARRIPQLNQLFAHVSTGNQPSVRLFQKAGYEHTGTLKRWIYENGAYTDVILFQKFL